MFHRSTDVRHRMIFPNLMLVRARGDGMAAQIFSCMRGCIISCLLQAECLEKRGFPPGKLFSIVRPVGQTGTGSSSKGHGSEFALQP